MHVVHRLAAFSTRGAFSSQKQNIGTQMKKYIPAVAIAAVVTLSAAAYFGGVFQRELPSNLGPAEVVAMPKILLLPAESNECQRRRVLDGMGGAVDNVDMTNGFTKVVEYVKLPRITREIVYYPAPEHKDCDAFTKDAATLHGPLFMENERDASGFRPLRERKYSIDGKLVSAGNQIDKGERFQTDFYAATGLTVRSETYNLVTKAVESETLYRPDGTALVRQAVKPSETSFTKEHFTEDGKVVAWKEARSYGSYEITLMYQDGKPRVKATRGINSLTMHEYRPDGTDSLSVQQWEYSTDITVYNEAGKRILDKKWKIDDKAPKDANGKPNMYVSHAIEVNETGKQIRRYDFRPDGTIETVTVHKDGEFWKNRVEYTLDSNGRVISSKPFDDKGDVMKVVAYAKDPGLRFNVPVSYKAMPQYSVPAGIKDHDEKMASEIQYHGGM